MFRSVQLSSVQCPVSCAVIARPRFGAASVGRVSLLPYDHLLWQVEVGHCVSSDHLSGVSSVPAISVLSIHFSSIEITRE
jgi:hypothetical protein